MLTAKAQVQQEEEVMLTQLSLAIFKCGQKGGVHSMLLCLCRTCRCLKRARGLIYGVTLGSRRDAISNSICTAAAEPPIIAAFNPVRPRPP